MSIELSIGSSQGRPAEWHDGIRADGRRLTACPGNADSALYFRNEHWIGDMGMDDAGKFNGIFAASVGAFNAKQTRGDRKMGPESTKPERQISYYEGVVNGTFCHGTGVSAPMIKCKKVAGKNVIIWRRGGKKDRLLNRAKKSWKGVRK